MTIKDSNTTIVSINLKSWRRYKICARIQIQLLFLLITLREHFFLHLKHSNTTLVSINPILLNCLIISHSSIQIQLLFLLIPIFINISFFIIVSKILLFKDIKKFYRLILIFISYIKK